MQKLALADDLMPLARKGLKSITIRKGRRHVEIGPLLLEATNGTVPSFEVNVNAVRVIPLNCVTKKELKGEGLNTFEELLTVMKRFYPEISVDSEVTVISFDVLKLKIAEAHETLSASKGEWKPGIVTFHTTRNEALRKDFYATVKDLREAGCIVDLWLADIRSVLNKHGFEMTIKALPLDTDKTS